MIEKLKSAIAALTNEPGGSLQVEFDFHTPFGAVDCLAELEMNGQTLILKDFCIYPRNPEPIAPGKILRHVLSEKRRLVEAVKALGLAGVELHGSRAANSSSANPGKLVKLVRKAR